MAGLVGIAALARLLSTRRARVEARAPAALPEAGEDPAEALRRKLSASREGDAAPAVEPSQAEQPRESLDERRARVHAKAQEALDAMQEPPA